MTSNLKLRQQRGGISPDTNLQGSHLSFGNNSRKGITSGKRNRIRRFTNITLITIPLIWYSIHHLYFSKNLMSLRQEDRRIGPSILEENENLTNVQNKNQKQEIEGEEVGANEAFEEEPPKQIQFDTPLLVFTCRRHEYLNRTLGTIYKYHPMMGSNSEQSPFSTKQILAGAPIVVSQDGQDNLVTAVIQHYKTLFQSIRVPLFHLQHMNEEHHDTILRDPYQALSQHYAWALDQVFSGKAYTSSIMNLEYVDSHFNNTVGKIQSLPKRVIILEEDIEIAVDFFSYMSATAPILDQDATLLAVSAYNDNGKQNLVGDPYRLLRSDFFPGLGWMLHSSLWHEIQPWPKAYWDDWLREPSQRKGRHIIRPEISRTFHFGTQGGASSNQYSHHLDSIVLNTENIDWKEQNLSYILDKDIFLQKYEQDVASAREVHPGEYQDEEHLVAHVMKLVYTDAVKIPYRNWNHFIQLAHLFDLMDNEKAGVPRTALNGIVECRPHGREGYLLYLVPSS